MELWKTRQLCQASASVCHGWLTISLSAHCRRLLQTGEGIQIYAMIPTSSDETASTLISALNADKLAAELERAGVISAGLAC